MIIVKRQIHNIYSNPFYWFLG